MAADNRSNSRIETLNGGDIQEIVQLPPNSGKELLADKLGIPPYNDPKDPQKAPFINYIYDNIIFAAEKGFPWNHVCLVVRFAHEYLKCILAEDHSLPNVITDFQKNADVIAPLNARHKQQYTDFVFDTILSHYNLYKYCFSHLREVIKPEEFEHFKYPIFKEVAVPPEPLPLAKGHDLKVWEYREKLKAIEIREREAMQRLKDAQESKETTVSFHKKIEDLDTLSQPYEKMSLSEMIKEVLQGQMEARQTEFTDKAEILMEDLTFKLEKTSIPRPAVLGEPPKWKPKTPVSTKTKDTNTNNKDKDSKSRKSSARSSKSPGRGSTKSSAKSKK